MVDFLLCVGRRKNRTVDDGASSGVNEGRPNIHTKSPQASAHADGVDSIGPNSAVAASSQHHHHHNHHYHLREHLNDPFMYVSDGSSLLLHEAEMGDRDRRGRDASGAVGHHHHHHHHHHSAPNSLLLHVIVATVDGHVWEVNVDPDFTVDKLKQMAIGHFYCPSETIKVSARYRLVTAGPSEMRLNDDFTLAHEGVKNNDDLLLLRTPGSSQSQSSTTESHQLRCVVSKAPTEAKIKSLTANVAPKNSEGVACNTVTTVDFQVELRRTLVSLIDVAQKIQLYNKTNLLTHITPSKSEEDGCRFAKGFVDPLALKQLTDMGFSVSKATEALQQKQMSAIDALEQLLQKEEQNNVEDKDDIEDDEKIEFRSSTASEDDSTPSSESNILGSKDNEASSSQSSHVVVGADATSPTNSSNRLLTLRQLVDTFTAYKRREFKPNKKALHSLCDMGFDQDKVLDALRVSGNKHDAAFEWLLSHWLTDDDLRSGLDPEGPVYRAIMSNATIRHGLDSPKILYAFLQMLENPKCANHWLNDPDASPILKEIFDIYHLEKYLLKMTSKSVQST